MICGKCGSSIVKVSGKSGGYYGCLGAAKSACDNKLLVRRSLTERVILAAVRDRLASSENLAYVLERVKQALARLTADAPESLRLKQAEFEQEERRLKNFLDFVADGRGSRALAQALLATEKRVHELRADLEVLQRSQKTALDVPPLAWLEKRVARVQELLERKTARSALLLRKLLGQPYATQFCSPAPVHERPGRRDTDAETRRQRLDRAYLRDAAPLLGVADLLERALD